MKAYCFSVKIDVIASNYYIEADRIDKALSSLTDFANICCCYEHPLEVRSVYATYRVFDGEVSRRRNYSIKRKVKPILRLVHSVEFDCGVDKYLELKDFIEYARSWNGHSS